MADTIMRELRNGGITVRDGYPMMYDENGVTRPFGTKYSYPLEAALVVLEEALRELGVPTVFEDRTAVYEDTKSRRMAEYHFHLVRVRYAIRQRFKTVESIVKDIEKAPPGRPFQITGRNLTRDIEEHLDLHFRPYTELAHVLLQVCSEVEERCRSGDPCALDALTSLRDNIAEIRGTILELHYTDVHFFAEDHTKPHIS